MSIDNRNKYYFQIIGWLAFFSLPLLFLSRAEMPTVKQVLHNQFFLVFSVLNISIFYVHHLVLLPKFFFKQRYITYVLLMFLLLVLVIFLHPFDYLFESLSGRIGNAAMPMKPMEPMPGSGMMEPGFEPMPRPKPMPGAMGKPKIDIISVVLFVLLIATSFALHLQTKWQKAIALASNKEKEKAKAELEFLRAQVNPHFLFNTLNNIYSLTLIKSDAASESVLKLSNIMRYILQEHEGDWVYLKDELNCINDYLDLQKLRLNSKTTLIYEVKGDVNDQKIAPLLFIPFIENMFKYGYSNHANSHLIIRIHIFPKEIVFYCSNTIFKQASTESTGIGIKNAEKRLEYLYPNRHELLIDDKLDQFLVQLTIKLTEA